MCIISHMSKREYFRVHTSNPGAMLIILIVLNAAQTMAALAQASAPQAGDPIRLPSITVNVYKEPDDVQRLPVSVTGVSETTLRGAGVRTVSDAGIYAPNTFFSEFTARKLSNARF